MDSVDVALALDSFLAGKVAGRLHTGVVGDSLQGKKRTAATYLELKTDRSSLEHFSPYSLNTFTTHEKVSGKPHF